MPYLNGNKLELEKKVLELTAHNGISFLKHDVTSLEAVNEP